MAASRLRHILCPFDLSEPSALAMRQAVACARSSGARLTALHVVDLGTDEANAASYLETLSAWLRDTSEETTQPVPINLVTRRGTPALEILSAAKSLSVDLLVLGTHGVSGIDRVVLGSVAEKVLRKAPCPVLTVPPHGAPAFSLESARVLCAIDFSDCSLAALEFVLASTLGRDAHLTLLHVLEWPWHEPPAPAFDELPRHEAEALLAYRERREATALGKLVALEPHGFEGRFRIRAGHGRSYEEILRVAAEERSDLIALGVHGRNRLDLALFGSNAHQLVRHAGCPVLTVRK